MKQIQIIKQASSNNKMKIERAFQHALKIMKHQSSLGSHDFQIPITHLRRYEWERDIADYKTQVVAKLREAGFVVTHFKTRDFRCKHFTYRAINIRPRKLSTSA